MNDQKVNEKKLKNGKRKAKCAGTTTIKTPVNIVYKIKVNLSIQQV